MTEQLASLAKTRGKVVLLALLLGAVQGFVHPETAGAVWGALAVPLATMAGVEAWISRGPQ